MATVGQLDIEIKGRSDGLDRDLRVVERKVKTTGDRMSKDMEQALSFGKFVAGLTALAAGTNVALKGIELGTALVAGQLERADRAAVELANSMRQVPVLGQVFGIGQGIGESIFGDAADAEAAEQQSRQAEARRIQNLKIIEDAQKRIRNLTRETALLNAGDDNARKRLQAEFRLEDDLAGIGKVPEEQREQLRRLAEERFRLETRPVQGAIGRGQEIGARTALSQAPPDQQQPNKRQVDTTNQLLTNIARIIGNLQNKTVAQ